MPADLPTAYEDLYPLLPPTAIMARDRRGLRRLLVARQVLEEAQRATVEAEDELRVAALAAYEAGDSWRVIGVSLGISRQAAQQRFRRR